MKVFQIEYLESCNNITVMKPELVESVQHIVTIRTKISHRVRLRDLVSWTTSNKQDISL
jgi:hypothetical protein